MSIQDQHDTPLPSRKAEKNLIAGLMQLYRGRGNAVSSKELAERIGRTRSTVRDLMEELVVDHGHLIASCSEGYYKIETVDEFREVMQRLEGRKEAARRRQRALQQAWEDSHE